MLKSSRETKLKNIWITSSFLFRSDSKLQVLGYQWTRPQILCQSAAQDALPKIQTVLSRSLGPPALTPRGRGLETLQATERWAHKVFSKGHFLLSKYWLRATKQCVRYKSPCGAPTGYFENLRDYFYFGAGLSSGKFWELLRSGLEFSIHDDPSLGNNLTRSPVKN